MYTEVYFRNVILFKHTLWFQLEKLERFSYDNEIHFASIKCSRSPHVWISSI